MDFLRQKSGNSRDKKNKECNKLYLERKQPCLSETFIRNMNTLPSFDSSFLVQFLPWESMGNTTRIVSELFMIYENKPLEKIPSLTYLPPAFILTISERPKKIRCTKIHSTGTGIGCLQPLCLWNGSCRYQENFWNTGDMKTTKDRLELIFQQSEKLLTRNWNNEEKVHF